MQVRRQDRVMSESESREFLERGEVGYLALTDGDEPYVIPLNYLLLGNIVYFHCATKGRKLDVIRANPRYCFAVSTMDEVKTGPEACDFGAFYRSVLVSGRAELVTDEDKKINVLTKLTEKHCPPHVTFAPVSRERAASTAVVALHIEQLVGKCRKK